MRSSPSPSFGRGSGDYLARPMSPVLLVDSSDDEHANSHSKKRKRQADTVEQTRSIRQQAHSTDDDVGCPICLTDNVALSEKAEVLGCSHVFCVDCLSRWTQQSRACPLCKRNIEGFRHGFTSARNFQVRHLAPLQPPPPPPLPASFAFPWRNPAYQQVYLRQRSTDLPPNWQARFYGTHNPTSQQRRGFSRWGPLPPAAQHQHAPGAVPPTSYRGAAYADQPPSRPVPPPLQQHIAFAGQPPVTAAHPVAYSQAAFSGQPPAHRHTRTSSDGDRPAVSGVPFQPRPYYWRLQQRVSASVNPPSVPAPATAESADPNLRWRQRVYNEDRWAIPVNADVHPFRRAPNEQHLREWIDRELHALGFDRDLTLMRTFIVGLVRSFGLEREWRDVAVASDGEQGGARTVESPVVALRMFLFDNTEHFWHELRLFGLSQLTVAAYDHRVRYQQGRPPASQLQPSHTTAAAHAADTAMIQPQETLQPSRRRRFAEAPGAPVPATHHRTSRGRPDREAYHQSPPSPSSPSASLPVHRAYQPPHIGPPLLAVVSQPRAETANPLSTGPRAASGAQLNLSLVVRRQQPHYQAAPSRANSSRPISLPGTGAREPAHEPRRAVASRPSTGVTAPEFVDLTLDDDDDVVVVDNTVVDLTVDDDDVAGLQLNAAAAGTAAVQESVVMATRVQHQVDTTRPDTGSPLLTCDPTAAASSRRLGANLSQLNPAATVPAPATSATALDSISSLPSQHQAAADMPVPTAIVERSGDNHDATAVSQHVLLPNTDAEEPQPDSFTPAAPMQQPSVLIAATTTNENASQVQPVATLAALQAPPVTQGHGTNRHATVADCQKDADKRTEVVEPLLHVEANTHTSSHNASQNASSQMLQQRALQVPGGEGQLPADGAPRQDAGHATEHTSKDRHATERQDIALSRHQRHTLNRGGSTSAEGPGLHQSHRQHSDRRRSPSPHSSRQPLYRRRYDDDDPGLDRRHTRNGHDRFRRQSQSMDRQGPNSSAARRQFSNMSGYREVRQPHQQCSQSQDHNPPGHRRPVLYQQEQEQAAALRTSGYEHSTRPPSSHRLSKDSSSHSRLSDYRSAQRHLDKRGYSRQSDINHGIPEYRTADQQYSHTRGTTNHLTYTTRGHRHHGDHDDMWHARHETGYQGDGVTDRWQMRWQAGQ